MPTSRLRQLPILLAALSVAYQPQPLCAAKRPVGRAALFDARSRLAKIEKLVGDSNAPTLCGKKRWQTAVATHREAIESTHTNEQFARAVNRMIGDTSLSHFHYYTDDELGFWQLRGVFGGNTSKAKVVVTGIVPERIDDRWFVRGILEGSPAASADIRVGDELLSVEDGPFSAIAAFRGRADVLTNIRLRRKPALTLNVELTPVKDSLFDATQRAISQSIRVVEHQGLKMAYLHGWSLLGNGKEYDLLVELQDEVDGLLLDYRDGVGGTWHKALTFLLGQRSGRHRTRINPRWEKPVVILTADGTRSAKEIVVDAVKRANRAPLVGTATPGHVISVGSVRRIGTDGLLMLPGSRFALEGKPTQPDYPVGRDIRYCAGADPQMSFAKAVLSKLIVQARSKTGL